MFSEGELSFDNAKLDVALQYVSVFGAKQETCSAESRQHRHISSLLT
jgi:hypothetical protein